jgi:hypothetical protein
MVDCKFEAILVYTGRPCLKNNTKKQQKNKNKIKKQTDLLAQVCNTTYLVCEIRRMVILG